jgi:hypothetical protein
MRTSLQESEPAALRVNTDNYLGEVGALSLFGSTACRFLSTKCKTGKTKRKRRETACIRVETSPWIAKAAATSGAAPRKDA